MALIKCDECGKEISDRAKKCIHCGCMVISYTKCSECGDRFASDCSSCPKCGCPNFNIANSNKSDTLCLSGLIVGIISFFIDFFGLVSATGLTLSIIGYTNATNQKSKTFSIVGMIFSGIELILKFIQLVNIISAGY